ncbi:anti-repressor SinI family protein [Niallia sp. Krafla_26]|uniref:anti-repressor SinI family protein n=1 Tax=Niallia sp. Krafla_26 TaxID=3064703 RepID=UPI003D16A9D1
MGDDEINTANTVDLLEIDEGWLQLIIEAKNIGLQLEDVRFFLANGKKDEILGIDVVTKPGS